MESIKLIDIPVYTLKQDNVKSRITLGLSLRDKDYIVLAKDIIDYFKLQSTFEEALVCKFKSYLFTKYSYSEDINNVLNKLKEILNG